MSDWKRVVRVIQTAPKSDIAVMVVTFALTVIFDLVIAIEVGLVMAFVLFMKRMSDETKIVGWQKIDTENVNDNIEYKHIPDNVKIFEIEGPLFFGSADKIADIIADDNTEYIILRMRAVTALDSTAMNALESLHEKCEEKGIHLILSHVNEQPFKIMQKAGFVDKIGNENFPSHIDSALQLVSK